MALYFVVTLLSFISISSAQLCYFYTSNGAYYDISALSLSNGQYAYKYVDTTSGIEWYFNICGNVQGLLDKNGVPLSDCPDNAGVCFTDGSKYFSGGQVASSSPSSTNGVTVDISYTQGDICNGPANPYNTEVEIYCGTKAQMNVLFVNTSSPCNPVITAISSVACVSTNYPVPSYTVAHGSQNKTTFSFLWIPGLLGLVLVCAVIARCQRNRRALYRKQCNDKQIEMSNITYQPMQQSGPTIPQQQQFVPMPYYPPYDPNQALGTLPSYMSHIPQFGYPIPSYPTAISHPVATETETQTE